MLSGSIDIFYYKSTVIASTFRSRSRDFQTAACGAGPTWSQQNRFGEDRGGRGAGEASNAGQHVHTQTGLILLCVRVVFWTGVRRANTAGGVSFPSGCESEVLTLSVVNVVTLSVAEKIGFMCLSLCDFFGERVQATDLNQNLRGIVFLSVVVLYATLSLKIV